MNSGEAVQWLGLGVSAVSAAVAAYYAYLTNRITRANESLVAATQRQVEAVVRPQIVVAPFLVPNSVVLYLRVRNSGQSAAMNLQLKLDRSFFRYGRKEDTQDLASYNAFQKPIQTFPPGAELTFALAQAFVIFGENADADRTPTEFTVTATFHHAGQSFTECTHVDLRPFLGSDPPKDPIVESLANIERAIKSKR